MKFVSSVLFSMASYSMFSLEMSDPLKPWLPALNAPFDRGGTRNTEIPPRFVVIKNDDLLLLRVL